MKKVNEFHIKRFIPSHIYQKGKEYFLKGKVNHLLFDRNYRVWTATVQGSDEYFVEADIRKLDQGEIDCFCDCPAFETYGYCKHIAAVLLAIMEKEKQEWGHSSSPFQQTNHFMEAIRSAVLQVPDLKKEHRQKQRMHVDYYCKWTYEDKLILELKTGVHHRYVVKNAYDFVDNVLRGREYVFTGKFSYHPDYHYFSQADVEIFRFIDRMKKNEEMYEPDSYYRKSSAESRYIVISPLVAKELLEQLVARNCSFEVGNSFYQEVTVVKGTLPFQFSFTKEEDRLLMRMDDAPRALLLEPYDIVFIDGIFYFPAEEQVPLVKTLFRFGTANLELEVGNNQADYFVSEVLPQLERVGKVDISEQVKEAIVQFPLRAKLYLDYQEGYIVGQLEYHYGDYRIDPFAGNGENREIIIREVEKEQEIMEMIEHANFHYNGKELFVAVDEEEMYEFLYRLLPLLEEKAELYLTANLKRWMLDAPLLPRTRVEMDQSANLLEVSFQLDGVDEAEIPRILEAVVEKKRYYRMRDGSFLSLEGDEMDSVRQFLDELQIKKEDLLDEKLYLPAYRGTQVDELIGTPKQYDETFQTLLDRLQSPEKQVFELPQGLQANLREYQKTGYQWFKTLSHYYLGGILADDMGLGKTVQAIAYMASEKRERGPHLVVAPSSVVYNWKKEFSRFAPDLETVIMTGYPEERHKRLESMRDADVWITSYATLRQDISLYKQNRFQTLILDEAQFIKNYQTKTSKAVRSIDAAHKFALSGTPIENSIFELWSIFQVVLPGLLPNQKTFKQLSNEQIARMTRPFILRRLKKDVLTELPEKIESVSISELTKEQKELYLGYLSKLQQETAYSLEREGFQQSRMKILAGLTRLRQICCHPSLFMENYSGASGKLEQLMETIKNALEHGRRMLIFSQFTSMHELIMKRLDAEGLAYFYISGQTPSEERLAMSERFNEGEKDIFLISLKAGGTGLNLTGADTVILYDLWWNPAVEDQATGRAYRFGQKNVVHVIRMIAEGTIEEKIYELQQKKRELAEQVIQPGETMLTSLSEEEIRTILSISS